MCTLNSTERDLPRVNQPSRDRLAELEPAWTRLQARADTLLNNDIQQLNRKLFDLGIGAIGTGKPAGPGTIG
jgi:hypothetical protein